MRCRGTGRILGVATGDHRTWPARRHRRCRVAGTAARLAPGIPGVPGPACSSSKSPVILADMAKGAFAVQWARSQANAMLAGPHFPVNAADKQSARVEANRHDDIGQRIRQQGMSQSSPVNVRRAGPFERSSRAFSAGHLVECRRGQKCRHRLTDNGWRPGREVNNSRVTSRPSTVTARSKLPSSMPTSPAKRSSRRVPLTEPTTR